jgi:membrane protease YdiL (CAAX protease family)
MLIANPALFVPRLKEDAVNELLCPPTRRRRAALWLAMLFALLFPTVAAWSYFLALAGETGGHANIWQQLAYVGGKIVQFTFPLFFLAFFGKVYPTRPLDSDFPRWRYGLAFGGCVFVLMLALYFGWLRGSQVLARTPDRLREKLLEVNMGTPSRYILLAIFIVAAHSFLEEYYWRWFVFGQLRYLLKSLSAIAVSSLAFVAHHVVVLYVYLPGKFWTSALPLSFAIAIGGAVWAWLYERGGKLGPPWLSHLLADAGIFIIGWDLMWPIY